MQPLLIGLTFPISYILFEYLIFLSSFLISLLKHGESLSLQAIDLLRIYL